MKSVSQNIGNNNLNQIFQPILAKDYRSINNVFREVENVLTTLTDQQKTDLATYIKGMSFQVIDQLKGNPKLVKIIQKVIQTVGPHLCLNLKIEIEEGSGNREIHAHKALLVAQSEYFREMFLPIFRAGDLTKLGYTKIPGGISTLIEYTVTGTLDQKEDMREILFFANKFSFQDLKRKAENKLMTFEVNQDLISLWNISIKSNADRLLSVMIFKYLNQTFFENKELENKIFSYCRSKGFFDDLVQLRSIMQNNGQLFLDTQSQLLFYSLNSIQYLPLLLSLLNVDKLLLALKNVSISNLNQLFQHERIHKLPINLHLDCDPISAVEVVAFAKTIAEHSMNIAHLRLSFNQPFVEVLILVQTLLFGMSFHALDLMGNEIQDLHIKSLIKSLFSSRVYDLDLGWNQIGDEGAATLANVLKHNKTLKSLNLQNNCIGYAGIKALAEALQSNNSLLELNLASNKIEPDDLNALVEIIQRNDTLKILNLQGNPIIEQLDHQALIELQNREPRLILNKDFEKERQKI